MYVRTQTPGLFHPLGDGTSVTSRSEAERAANSAPRMVQLINAHSVNQNYQVTKIIPYVKQHRISFLKEGRRKECYSQHLIKGVHVRISKDTYVYTHKYMQTYVCMYVGL